MALGIFLFLKQIVDMHYRVQILDYIMCSYLAILLIYGVFKDKKYLKIKESIEYVDILVIGVAIVYLGAFLRDTSGIRTFIKIESAFAMYLLGRLFSKDIIKHAKWLAISGYITIYINLVKRYINWNYKIFGSDLNNGGMYYYKTDLAVGVIIAVIFIYFYSNNSIIKWFTIFPVSGYLVFYSNARMQWPIMLFEYLMILIFEIKNKKEIKKNSKIPYYVLNIIMSVLVIVILISIQFIDFEKYAEVIHNSVDEHNLLERICHSRQIYFWDTMWYFRDQTFLRRIIGFDLVSIMQHNVMFDRAHSEYIEHLYATGYLGTAVMMCFWIKLINKISKINNSVRRISIMFTVFFLLTGLTIECLELTQMSWFVFLFAGYAITEESRQRKQ